jgi:uncharacterized protein
VTSLAELLALQRIDTAVDQANHRKAHLAERTAHQQAASDVAALEARLGSFGLQRTALEAQQAELEERIGVASSRIGEIEKRIKIMSTPREITALEHERESLSAKRTALEDTELEVMESLESIANDEATIAEQALARRGDLDQAALALSAAETAATTDLRVLTTERAAVVATIDPALLSRYESMRTRFAGVAVATIEHAHCTGCRLQVSPSELERIRAEPADALVACEQCGRLLAR